MNLTEKDFDRINIQIIKKFLEYKNQLRGQVADPQVFDALSYEFENFVNSLFSKMVADEILKQTVANNGTH